MTLSPRTLPRPPKGRTLLALGLTGAMGLTLLGTANASSHREAPLISNDPAADNTDLYAFQSPDKPGFTTLIANWIPAEDPAAGPNFYNFADDVNYSIYVDNNGDAVPDITYDWRFSTEFQNPNTYLYNTNTIKSLDDPAYNYRQYQDLYVTKGGVRTQLLSHKLLPPNNVGPAATPNYAALAAAAVYDLPGGGKNFSGQRDDAFYADIGSIFDTGQLRPFLPAYKPAMRAATAGKDFFAGQNIHTTSLEIPTSELVQNASQPIIQVWSTASRPKVRVYNQNNGATPVNRGRFVQVSRLANPLVNEVVIPLGLKDTYNGLAPKNDAAALSVKDSGDGVTIPLVQKPELAGLITGLYGIPTPPAPRNDLVKIFLTGIDGLNAIKGSQPADLLRLNTSTPVTPVAQQNRLGLLAGQNDGYPNGRRLGDDVIDIALRAVAGGTPFTPDFNKSPNNALGDGVDKGDGTFLTSFPYQATPWQGFSENNETRGAFTTGSQ